MDTDRNSYGKIIKATGLFGGVKVFEIIISIIRSKAVALLLGPSGMGIYGLISSPISLIKQLTSFGLSTSGVREVSKAYSGNNQEEVNKIITVLRKLVWLTGTLGVVVTFFLARWLSEWSFGNGDYTLWFRLVSITLLIDQLVVGQQVLMQGTFHYTYLAKSSIIGHTLGLLVTIPIYYFWGVKGVVPVFILHSVTSLFLSWFFSRKIPYEKVKLSVSELFRNGSTMLALGVAIALASAIGYGKDFLIRIFISNNGGVAEVGLFNAGIAISTSYIGLVLSAMGTDYAPRLSSISNDNSLFIEAINRQLQLLILIVGPLVALFIVFIKQVVILLYSTEFIPVSGMIEWTMYGMIFRAVSFCFSYAVIAKADSKLFFLNELIATIYFFLLSILGYQVGGLEGMGIAYCFGYLLYSIQLLVLQKVKYGFRFEGLSIRIMVVQLILVTVLLIVSKVFSDSIFRYIFGAVVTLIIFVTTYFQLDSMINIKRTLSRVLIKRANKDEQ